MSRRSFVRSLLETSKVIRFLHRSLNQSFLKLRYLHRHRQKKRNNIPIAKASPAANPSNEAARLEALQRYEILDTPPEDAFDDLTALASFICGTPIALVSLIDSNRQWFKSKVGLEATETPRELAFCAHAILSPSEPFIVPNALDDERFATNPLVVSDPDIRFYAGVPLVTADNYPLGTLCVIDRIPRRLNREQIDALRALGRQVITQMDLRIKLEKEKELNELKSRFVSMTSHEFRTPLTTIMGSADLLEYYSDKWSKEKKQSHLQRIQNAVQHMTLLLDDVLLIGKADAGKLKFNPSPLDLKQFCLDLIEELQPNVSNHHSLTFVNHAQDIKANLDQKLLRHILSNLLSNAIKYSPDGGTVNFELFCQEGGLIFQIQDFGIGIPEKDLPHLFESFYRANNVGDIPGTGLGLAIVKRFVDFQDGKIAVESEVGVGTRFTVQIPFHPVANYSS
ncbi:GAF domain-containing sensor histidine kinase [Microcoleus sp. FACHB-SPT15]|uniref:GAF domain-containing sensor histidine kinase n=1 Tax=Microcoleus sp. FACHB-SPT15 TaxID=2692830 RepID=UPI00177F1DA0|nr:GAF domain-containing sensor histidine kinase [Microcoleus sp. FACHB-SPT15]MBD1805478.1 GAF domain-containing sensor histidine kinase [Microcoleus sp. FACHB-SPT15]